MEAVNVKVAVIGGAGRMGRWLARYFSSQGHTVVVSDVKMDKARAFADAIGVEVAENNVEAVKGADLVVVSTPIPTTTKIVREIASHTGKGAVVVEISSLKSGVVGTLAELAELNVRPLSIHPLFGPGAQLLRGRKIAVVPVVDLGAERKLVEELFPEAEIVIVEAEEHDRVMALILSLPHFVNIVFASVLGDEDLTVLKRLGGPTFELQLILAESVMTEDPALHASIQMNNKYTLRYINNFLSKARIIKKQIANEDEEEFTALYNRVQSLLSEDVDFAKAYEKMYKVLGMLR